MHRPAALCFALLYACSNPPPVLYPPPFGPDPGNPEAARFFFPTGIAIDPTSTWIVVANSNTDRQYDAGAVYSFRASDLTGYFLCTPAGCPPSPPPVTLAFPAASLAGKAMIGNFAGPVVLTDGPVVNGAPRMTGYTASRDSGLLNGVVLDTSNGALSCRVGAGVDPGNDCRAGVIDLGRKANVEGPYAIVAASIQPTVVEPGVSPPDRPIAAVLVTSVVPHIDDTQSGLFLTSGHLAALSQDDPTTVLYKTPVTDRTSTGGGVGSGTMVFDDRTRELILSGCFMRFASASAGGEATTAKCSTFADASVLRFLSADAGSSTNATATRIFDLTSQLHAQDVPAIALGSTDATNGLRSLYMTLRAPDGVAQIGLAPDPAFPPIVRSVVTTSSQPSQLIVLARPPGSTGTDLVVVTAVATFQTSTTAGKLLILDAGQNRIVGQVEGVGDSPFGIAQFTPKAGDTSARLVVTVFGSCRISLVEVPYDNPGNAALRANIGSCPQ
ncbi:MAG TPA: hypothetical protein VG496_13920 [Myxococcales bacterium]|nr:hypothetical protein [Myxococcales bacterium]